MCVRMCVFMCACVCWCVRTSGFIMFMWPKLGKKMRFSCCSNLNTMTREEERSLSNYAQDAPGSAHATERYF